MFNFKLQTSRCAYVCQNRFLSLMLSLKHPVMVKYCGYLLGEDWLLQRAITKLGYEQPKTYKDALDLMMEASRDVRLQTGVYSYTTLRRVKTLEGKKFWCIAFACNDPCQSKGLPTSGPPEEKYKALKELLQKQVEPRWFRAAWSATR